MYIAWQMLLKKDSTSPIQDLFGFIPTWVLGPMDLYLLSKPMLF